MVFNFMHLKKVVISLKLQTQYSNPNPLHSVFTFLLILSICLNPYEVQLLGCPSTTPFPKVIGGSVSATEIFHINYHEATKQLIAVGYTTDYNIRDGVANSNWHPIIVLFKGDNLDMQWEKYIVKPGCAFTSLQIDDAGDYMILVLNQKYLITMKTDGTFVSLRDAGRTQDIGKGLQKQATINGVTKTAYAILNLNVGYSFLAHLDAIMSTRYSQNYRFQLISYQFEDATATINWARISKQEESQPLWIEYDSVDDCFYIHSYYFDNCGGICDGYFAITKVLTDGTEVWSYRSYSLMEAQYPTNFFGIKRDTTTPSKLILFTVFDVYYPTNKYARLVINSGTVTSANVFTPVNALGPNMYPRAMHIIDEDNLILAIIGYSAASGIHIATFKFSSLTVTYQFVRDCNEAQFPGYGVFLSSSVIALSTSAYSYTTDYSIKTSASLGQQQSIIFTNEQTSSCGVLSTNAPINAVLKELTGPLYGLNLISSDSILVSTPFTPPIFKLDGTFDPATGINDLNQAKMTDKECMFGNSKSVPVTVPTTYTYQAGTDVIIAMPKMDCGSGTYSLTSTSPIPGFIVYNADNTVTITKISQKQDLPLNLKLTFGGVSSIWSFQLILTNDPPTCNIQGQTFSLPVNNVISKTIIISDFQSGDVLSMVAATSIPAFVTFNGGSKYTIAPTKLSQVSATPYQVDTILTDAYDNTVCTFFVQVTNTAPYFSQPLNDQTVFYGLSGAYILPAQFDDETNPITFTISQCDSTALPGCITHSSGVITTIPAVVADIATWCVKISLSDTALTNDYTFNVKIINTAPYFTASLIDQTVIVFQSNSYTLPSSVDNESNTIKVKATEQGKVGLPAFITFVDPVFTINPKLQTLKGTYIIEVTLTDAIFSSITTFTVIIKENQPPIFSIPSLPDQTVKLNDVIKYALPTFSDPEGDPVTYTISPGGLAYVSCTSDIFTFNPTQFTEVGSQFITVTLDDGYQKNPYKFQLSVTNTAPYFISDAPIDLNLKLNDNFLYDLPAYIDDEGNPITVSILPVLKWVTVIGNTLRFKPVDFTSVGINSITVMLSDGQPLSNSYVMQVSVTNTAPYFMSMLPKNQKMHVMEEVSYTLPPYKDDEGHTIYFSHIMPSFITFSGGTYYFQPVMKQHVGIFLVQGSMTDTQMSTSFEFKVTVVNDQPYFTEVLQDQTVKLGTQLKYVLPDIYDTEKQKIKIVTTSQGLKPLPKFVKFGKNQLLQQQFTITPLLSEHVGNYTISISLSDGIAPIKNNYFILVVPPNITTNNILYENNENLTDIQLFKASLKALSVSKDAKLTLKFHSEGSTRFLDLEVVKDDFHIYLTTQEFHIVDFDIIQREPEAGTIKLQLNFDKNDSISQTAALDEIEIITTKDVYVQKGKLVTVLQEGQKSFIYVPTIVSPGMLKFAQAFDLIVGYTSSIALPLGLFANFFLSIIIQQIWGLLNDMSFLTILSMISVSLPGISQMIQASLLNFIYLDVLMTDKWFIPLFFPNEEETDSKQSRLLEASASSQEEDGPLNENFDTNGFSSLYMIKNLGSTIVYLFLLIAAYIIMYLFKLLGRQSPLLHESSLWLHDKLFWGAYLRFILQQSQPIMIACTINFYKIGFTSFGEGVSSVLSIFCMTLMPLSMIAIGVTIFKKKKEGSLENEEIKSRYGEMVEGLNQSSILAIYWNIIILARWSVTTVILIYWRNNSSYQIILLLIISIYCQCLIVGGQPLQSKEDNKWALINEVFVSIYLYIMLSLSDFNFVNLYRQESGWCLLAVVFASITINFVKFFINVAIILYRALSKCQQRRRARIYQATLDIKSTLQGLTLGLQPDQGLSGPKLFDDPQMHILTSDTNLKQISQRKKKKVLQNLDYPLTRQSTYSTNQYQTPYHTHTSTIATIAHNQTSSDLILQMYNQLQRDDVIRKQAIYQNYDTKGDGGNVRHGNMLPQLETSDIRKVSYGNAEEQAIKPRQKVVHNGEPYEPRIREYKKQQKKTIPYSNQIFSQTKLDDHFSYHLDN